jgi:hypothetical protein
MKLTYEKFSGINNVLPSERLTPERKTGITPLAAAVNVDVGVDRELRRRAGYSAAAATCHKNVWQGAGFMLATADNDLINVDTAAVLSASLGVARVWYVNLPDGRTAFSNGSLCGITDGATATTWGVPLPAATGAAVDTSGSLHPGKYRIALTHVRDADGLEGGTTHLTPFTVADGGITLTGLTALAGHSTNVYLSSANDDALYLAGNAAGTIFSFTGANETLIQPCKTDLLYPAPAGTVSSLFGGRALVAVGPVLYASRANQWELFDRRKDFKQFDADITLVQPVDDGVFIGTENELAFLKGRTFDTLEYTQVVAAGVVLGSGAAVRGELLPQGEGAATGAAMVCIADRVLVAGFSGGTVVRLTQGVYATDADEVAATFRMRGGIPQYLAIEQ